LPQAAKPRPSRIPAMKINLEVCFLKAEVRGPRSEVRAQSPLAWLWLGTRMAAVAGALARAVSEGVQNAGYRGVGRENSHQDNGDGSERNDKSNQ
jgi:hypothetical protein